MPRSYLSPCRLSMCTNERLECLGLFRNTAKRTCQTNYTYIPDIGIILAGNLLNEKCDRRTKTICLIPLSLESDGGKPLIFQTLPISANTQLT